MPNITQQQRARLIVVCAALAGIAVVVSTVGTRSPGTNTTEVHGVLQDAGFLHASKGGTMTDLDSGDIPGGGSGQSIVNLMPGDVAGEVIAAPGWQIMSTQQNGTTVTVTIKNTSGRTARFSGILNFTRAPADAGVADAP